MPADAITDINVYQPYANFQDFDHPMTEGLRPNAHQLVEAATLGYGIGTDASPMTVVDTAAWEGAGGHVIGTTTTLLTGEDPAIDRNLDDGALTSVGELAVGDAAAGSGSSAARCRRRPRPQDHRFGLRNYALTYSGLFLMENAIEHDVKRARDDPPPPLPPPDRQEAGQGAEAAQPAQAAEELDATPTRAAARRARP